MYSTTSRDTNQRHFGPDNIKRLWKRVKERPRSSSCGLLSSLCQKDRSTKVKFLWPVDHLEVHVVETIRSPCATESAQGWKRLRHIALKIRWSIVCKITCISIKVLKSVFLHYVTIDILSWCCYSLIAKNVNLD